MRRSVCEPTRPSGLLAARSCADESLSGSLAALSHSIRLETTHCKAIGRRGWQACNGPISSASRSFRAPTRTPPPEVWLHWELEFFAEAGIPPLDILRFATQASAETVGAGDDLGTLEVGKLADILLLDANPLEEIKNTQSIWRVIKGGWVFDPEELRPERN